MTSLLSKDLAITPSEPAASMLYAAAMTLGRLASMDNLARNLYGDEDFSSYCDRLLEIQGEIFELYALMEDTA